jgi:hypothetical protein
VVSLVVENRKEKGNTKIRVCGSVSVLLTISFLLKAVIVPFDGIPGVVPGLVPGIQG